MRLYPYQAAWINDTSRLKIALKARQTGFTTTLCFEAIKMAAEKRCNILVLSTSERQSYEVMDRIHNLLVAFKKFANLQLSRESRSEIVFPNRSKITSLPASPATVRGYSGHIFLDEFAFHKDAKKIWTSMLPTTAKGYSVRVVSTPAGRQGKFFELWDSDDMGFGKHVVDIYQAVRQGCGIDIELFRQSMDPESFAQEFECQFVDEAHSFYPMELIIPAISAECEDSLWDGRPRGMFYAGIDVGRRQDLTVIYVFEKLGDVFYTRLIRELSRTSFDAQRAEIEAVTEKYPLYRICIDSTGLGMQLAEELKRQYSSLIEPVTITMKVKEDLVTYARIVFEKRLVRIPDHQALIRDIHSIRKIVTSAGNVRFDAERNEGSHADRFWAMALALHAASRQTGQIYVTTRQRREGYALTMGY